MALKREPNDTRPLDKKIFREPDLSGKPYHLSLEKIMDRPAEKLFSAWTKELGVWFVVPESVLMTGEVNTLLSFETEFRADEHAEIQRHPHYGRLLDIVPGKLIKMTWVTGAGGTEGAETVVTVELISTGAQTVVRLAHAGFRDEESKNRHQQAWPLVIAQLERR